MKPMMLGSYAISKREKHKKWAKRQLVPLGTCVASNHTYLVHVFVKKSANYNSEGT
jgi:hypothetical protein